MNIETILFFSATSAHRIIRLSIELFLVEHTRANGFTLSTAGLLILLSNICDVIGNLIFLRFPFLFLGSKTQTLFFVTAAPILIVFGYVGLFLSTTLLGMIIFVCINGLGISAWYVNYKTLYTTAPIHKSMSHVAQLRQAFESIGFLIPSICLAVISSSMDLHSDSSSSSGNIIKTTALVLAVVGAGFFILSAKSIFKYTTVACDDFPDNTSTTKTAAADTTTDDSPLDVETSSASTEGEEERDQVEESKTSAPIENESIHMTVMIKDDPEIGIEPKNEQKKNQRTTADEEETNSTSSIITSASTTTSIRASSTQRILSILKVFFTTSMLHCFIAKAVILALFSAMAGSLSTVSEVYFSRPGTDLWIAALGLPLGGVVSAVIALTIGKLECKKRLLVSSFCLIMIFVTMAATTNVANSFFEIHQVGSAVCYFLFGLLSGFFASEVWTESFSLWLQSVQPHVTDPLLVNQVNAIGNMGDKLLTGIIFQIQTFVLDLVNENGGADETATVGIVTFVFFSLLVGTTAIVVVWTTPQEKVSVALDDEGHTSDNNTSCNGSAQPNDMEEETKEESSNGASCSDVAFKNSIDLETTPKHGKAKISCNQNNDELR